MQAYTIIHWNCPSQISFISKFHLSPNFTYLQISLIFQLQLFLIILLYLSVHHSKCSPLVFFSKVVFFFQWQSFGNHTVFNSKRLGLKLCRLFELFNRQWWQCTVWSNHFVWFLFIYLILFIFYIFWSHSSLLGIERCHG